MLSRHVARSRRPTSHRPREARSARQARPGRQARSALAGDHPPRTVHRDAARSALAICRTLGKTCQRRSTGRHRDMPPRTLVGVSLRLALPAGAPCRTAKSPVRRHLCPLLATWPGERAEKCGSIPASGESSASSAHGEAAGVIARECNEPCGIVSRCLGSRVRRVLWRLRRAIPGREGNGWKPNRTQRSCRQSLAVRESPFGRPRPIR